MAQRTGVPSLIKFADILCRLLVKYGGSIKAANPGNTTLADAIDAALIACAALSAALLVIREYGD